MILHYRQVEVGSRCWYCAGNYCDLPIPDDYQIEIIQYRKSGNATKKPILNDNLYSNLQFEKAVIYINHYFKEGFKTWILLGGRLNTCNSASQLKFAMTRLVIQHCQFPLGNVSQIFVYYDVWWLFQLRAHTCKRGWKLNLL